jgi:glutamate/aspartate transport system permease protein
MSEFDFGVIARALPYLWQGMQYSLALTLVAMSGGIVLGTALALARLSSYKPLALAAAGYVNLMRSVPLILVIFWFYFLVPLIAQWLSGSAEPVAIGADRSAFITFTLFEAAFCCEIIRAGIQSVPRGQMEAAQALGLDYRGAMRHVILPQALRNMLPLLLTQAIILFQDTSLVYVLAITDFLGAASKIAQRDGRLLEMYVFAALVYFAISYALSLSVKHMQRRLAA